jgi:tetratricopeptide (TPR) repeat protein
MKKKLCLFTALILSLSSFGCVEKIKARIEIKDGNDAYEKEDYRNALVHYSRARQIDNTFVDLDRMIGYSEIGLYVPEDKSPANEKHADTAIAELTNYLKKRPDDRIARDALINMYLNANRISQAIDYFRNYLQQHPADLDAVKSIATLYAKQGDFNESLNIIARGKQALERSIEMKPDYAESMAYLNLLWRQQALLETDPLKAQADVAQADQIRNRAMEIVRQKKAAAGAKKS